jgi:hypothetical protein
LRVSKKVSPNPSFEKRSNQLPIDLNLNPQFYFEKFISGYLHNTIPVNKTLTPKGLACSGHNLIKKQTRKKK